VVTTTPNSSEILKIVHYKSRFSLKTRINLGGISPTKIGIRMGISNIELKISPKVEYWPHLRMRSRKLAKNT